jgi:anti-sigma regulatory factor (Ser/Thr protein kinase)
VDWSEAAVAGQVMSFSVKIEMPSHPRVLSVVRSTVLQFASAVGFSEEESRQLVLAVDEALANVIRHAYGNRFDQAIELTVRRLAEDSVAPGACNDGIEFTLVDFGQPAEPGALKGRPLDEIRPGGLGMHLITSIMDEVKYEPLPGRNQMRLVKRLNAQKNPKGE